MAVDSDERNKDYVESLKDLQERERERHLDDEGAEPLSTSEQAALDQMEAGLRDGDEAPDADYGKDRKPQTDKADDDDESEIPYNPEKKRGGGRGQGWLSRHKKQVGIGGGITGLVVGSGFGLMTILSGPAQLVHLGETLAKFDRPTDNAITRRFGNFSRNARAAATGDVGETRVGYLGSRRFHAIEAELKTKGVEFDRTGSSTGRPDRLLIDPETHPSIRTPEDAARTYGVEPERFTVLDDGSGRYAFDLEGMSGRRVKMLANTSVEVLERGRVSSASASRVIGKFFDTPNPIFHPMKYLQSEIANSIDRGISRATARFESITKWREGFKARFSDSRIGQARTRLANSAGKYGNKIGAALITQAGVCLIHDAAELIPLVNYAEVVAPSVITATQHKAISSQIKAGVNVDVETTGALTDLLKDSEGKTVWEAKALNALAYGTAGVGVDAATDVWSAFSGELTAGGILSSLDGVFSRSILGVSAYDILCNDVAVIGGAVLGVALIALFPPASVGKAAVTAGTAGTTMLAMQLAQKYLVDVNKVTLSDSDRAFGGPQGGFLLAAGAREGANITARSSVGGVPLSDADVSAYFQEEEEREVKEFQSKSFFARVFDPYETRSILGSMVGASSNSIWGNITKAIGSILRFPSLFASTTLSLLPNASAAGEEAYDWPMPLYGIPRDVLEDPTYDDPYENGRIVGTYLDGSVGSELKELADKCFGIKLQKGSMGWEAVRDHDVITLEDEYQEAGCEDRSGVEWERFQVWLVDNTVVDLVDCWGPDEGKSCARLGFETTPSTSTGTNTGASGQYIPDCSANNGNAKIACVAIDTMLNIPYKNSYSTTDGCKQDPSASNDPNPTALDCSAFTSMAVYRAFGTNAPRASVAYLTDPNFQVVGDTRDGESGNIRDIQPGDLIGRGRCASSGEGCNGHIGIVVSYNPTTQELVTVETDRCTENSRIVTTKGLKIDGKGGDYEWAVRYIGPKQ